jgi:hypothetical protein
MLRIIKKSKPPKFAIGENVNVLKEEKIAQTLDSENKLDGCLFMKQMWKFCGQEFKIINLVKHIYEKKMLKTRASLYMLEGLVCDGSVDVFDHPCDRKCHFLWHEHWLERTRGT